ncbi:MAG: insulinase family protein [Bacteroidetes bacterium]|nr:insulinase family protein [Bacteroidota bacterium]
MIVINKKAKYFLAFFSFLCANTMLFAQAKDPYEMTVSGVKVIVQPSGNEIVEIQTIIKGGVQNYPADKAGIESLAMSALTECGTVKDDKNSFKNKLDKVSAQVYGSNGMDYATFTMNCIKSDFDVVWPLYVDALTIPLFDKKEFERTKQDAINSLKAQGSDPDYSISKFARQVTFAGKNYSKDPEGSEATVSKLTPEETKAYYQSILTKSRLLIVVVGEIERSVLEQKIQALLAAIPDGKPFALKKETFNPSQNSFKPEKKELATNYIQGVTSAPLPGTPDFNAFVLASRIFYDRHYLDVRSKNGLSYAPYTYLDGGLTSSFNIDVSTTNPNKYIEITDALIAKTRREGFTSEEVKDMKTSYLTSFFQKQETNNAQAASLAANEILHNNWHRSVTINSDIKKISASEVSNVFNKYVTHISWVYQGDPAKANATLFTQPIQEKTKLPASKLSTDKKN